jgi:hypothetical protein
MKQARPQQQKSPVLSNSSLPRHSDAAFESDDMTRTARAQVVIEAAAAQSRRPCTICFEMLTPAQLVSFNSMETTISRDIFLNDNQFFPPITVDLLRARIGGKSSSSSASGCQHKICRSCLRAYLGHEVNEGKVMQIRCPGLQDVTPPAPASSSSSSSSNTSSSSSASTSSHSFLSFGRKSTAPPNPPPSAPKMQSQPKPSATKPCSCIGSSEFIHRNVSQEVWRKYERFLKLKADQSYRSCPNRECLHVQQFVHRSTVGSEKLPPVTSTALTLFNPKPPSTTVSMMMECEKCSQQYCFRHDLAHSPSVPCEVYEKTQAKENAESEKVIATSSVRCPNPTCGVRTTRSMGCNHVSAHSKGM